MSEPSSNLAHRGRGGFSLLSVLVAVVLLGVGVAALSSAGIYVLAAKTSASSRAAAVSIAVSRMEELKAQDPATLASESPVQVDETGAPTAGGAFTRSVTVTSDASAADAKRIVVDVRYPMGRGRTGTVNLITIVYEGA